MIPFMAESIYQNLLRSLDKGAPESVHLCGFPEADERRIDAQLERDMDLVLKIVVLGRAARNGSNRKNRQPLAQMFVKAEEELGDFYKEIIEDELNIKAVTFTQDVSAFTSYSFKPQLKTLGPKYGKRLGEIRTALMELDGSAAKKELDANGVLRLELQGGAVELAPEDLLIEMTQSDRYFTVEDGGVTVAIDTELTEALIEEGFVRELVSKFQTMRKEAGYDVTDRIQVRCEEAPIARVVAQAVADFDAGGRVTLGHLDEAQASCDPKRLEQAIGNLLANAAKYAPGADVEVEGVLDTAARAYRVRVRDRGPGIPPEDLPFVADRFYRGSNAGDAPGAGLGLFIVRYLVEQMGGGLSLENAEPGLAAVLELPLAS